MIRSVLLIICLCSFSQTEFAQGSGTAKSSNPSQQDTGKPSGDNQPVVVDPLEVMPEFPGGEQALFKYIKQNLRWPAQYSDSTFSGRVVVRFIITKSGKIDKPEILKGIPGREEFSKEVIRLVTSMPNWKPGLFNGKAVDSYHVLPINFSRM
jgi:protein TonB